MTPVVIQLQKYKNEHVVSLGAVPNTSRVAKASDLYPLELPAGLLDAHGTRRGKIVRRWGTVLGNGIARNQAVKEVLKDIARRAGDREQLSIVIAVGPPELENLPWEAIWRRPPLNYLALYRGAPIARTASLLNTAVQIRTVESKLRVLVVLSGDSRIHPIEEWRRIETSLSPYADRLSVRVIGSDESIERACRERQFPFEGVVTSSALVRTALRFRPNIIHFFCHGKSRPPQLQLTTRDRSAITVTDADLEHLSKLESLWLMVLNCCQGGEASSDTCYSLARHASDAGTPVVVAMRESIPWQDGNIFSGAFYGSLIPSILDVGPPSSGQPRRELPASEILLAVRDAREELHRAPDPNRDGAFRTADRSPEWTVPVVYVRLPMAELGPARNLPDAPLPAPGLEPRPEEASPEEGSPHREPLPRDDVSMLRSVLAYLESQPPAPGLADTVAKVRSRVEQEESRGPRLDISRRWTATRPQTLHLQMNACDLWPSRSERLAESAREWIFARRADPSTTLLSPEPAADLAEWRQPEVGWGLVVPRAMRQLPAPLERLVRHRNGRVYQYHPDVPLPLTTLWDRDAGEYLDVNGTGYGTRKGRLPYYLMIVGDPASIPWAAQYTIAANRAVGRLDLDERGLQNYVTALLGEFDDAPADALSSLVWAVDLGPDDITRLMRHQIAQRVHERLRNDPDTRGRARLLCEGDATCEALVKAITESRPGLIVTTSHGKTGPVGARELMARDLGLPVDLVSSSLSPSRLLDAWDPAGAVWYCHACCSAGCDSVSVYRGLFAKGSSNDDIVSAIAGLGARVAPLPRALLGAPRPLRAFIGHVEPTFDCTLRNPLNGQNTTDAIVDALYAELYRGMPVGHALRGWWTRAGGLQAGHDFQRTRFNQGSDNLDELLFLTLAARDVRSTVVLGDPAVALPVGREQKRTRVS